MTQIHPRIRWSEGEKQHSVGISRAVVSRTIFCFSNTRSYRVWCSAVCFLLELFPCHAYRSTSVPLFFNGFIAFHYLYHFPINGPYGCFQLFAKSNTLYLLPCADGQVFLGSEIAKLEWMHMLTDSSYCQMTFPNGHPTLDVVMPVSPYPGLLTSIFAKHSWVKKSIQSYFAFLW